MCQSHEPQPLSLNRCETEVNCCCAVMGDAGRLNMDRSYGQICTFQRTKRFKILGAGSAWTQMDLRADHQDGSTNQNPPSGGFSVSRALETLISTRLSRVSVYINYVSKNQRQTDEWHSKNGFDSPFKNIAICEISLVQSSCVYSAPETKHFLNLLESATQKRRLDYPHFHL